VVAEDNFCLLMRGSRQALPRRFLIRMAFPEKEDETLEIAGNTWK
jgi:hypothetical protein